MAQAQDGGTASPRGQERRKRERIGACYAWNESRCTFVRCRYEHVRSRCGGDHPKSALSGEPEERGARNGRSPIEEQIMPVILLVKLSTI